MKRREVIRLSGAAALWPALSAVPAPGSAQQRAGVRHVGVIMGLAETDATAAGNLDALRKALHSAGWIEGKSVRFTVRYAAGSSERARALASEVVGLQPDLIVAHTTPVVAALKAAAPPTLPIVFVSIPDPVVNGFAASFARPGGYMTGFTNFEFEIAAKWIELLKELAPRTARVTLMLHPDTMAYYQQFVAPIEVVAKSNAMQVALTPARDLGEIERIVAGLARDPGGGLIVLPSIPITTHYVRIIELAAHYRVPTMYPFDYHADHGGLAAYGVDLDDLFRRAAAYVDRILKGDKPADLPVQTPTRFRFVINMRTARSLGIEVPFMLLARTDRVVE